MKAKLYDEYTDDEIIKIIKRFELEIDDTIYLTLSNFLNLTLNLSDIPFYFLNWNNEECSWTTDNIKDYVFKTPIGGYFCYSVSDNKCKLGEYMGNNYEKAIKSDNSRFIEFYLPINISEFIQLCKNNSITLYWRL